MRVIDVELMARTGYTLVTTMMCYVHGMHANSVERGEGVIAPAMFVAGALVQSLELWQSLDMWRCLVVDVGMDFENCLGDFARVHGLKSIVPVFKRPEAPNDLLNIECLARQKYQHAFPDRPSV